MMCGVDLPVSWLRKKVTVASKMKMDMSPMPHTTLRLHCILAAA
jgi:hypothetical protein